MQKSGPGTEAQSESISSGDRNLIQVILLFIPHLADLKNFSTSLTLVQTSLGNVCTSGGHQEILVWNFYVPLEWSLKTQECPSVSAQGVRGLYYVSLTASGHPSVKHK